MASTLDAVPPRTAVVIALLTLVPVAAFGLTKLLYLSAAVTAINVVIIGTCIYLLFSPIEGGSHGHGAEA